MGPYIIAVILIYALFVVGYLLWDRIQMRKKNAAKNSAFKLFRAAPKEDIIGKSKFDLRQSRTEATTLINNEKEIKNASIFVDENEKKSSATIPLEKLDEVFSNSDLSDEDSENSNEINLEIENKAPEFEPETNDSSDLDEDETEDEDTEGVAGVSIALGLGFDDLASMVRTVDKDEKASADEREEAGRVLVEIRQTDLFEQVVSGMPKKKTIAATLMDEYFAAFQRKKKEAGELDEPTVKAPRDFDVRSFA